MVGDWDCVYECNIIRACLAQFVNFHVTAQIISPGIRISTLAIRQVEFLKEYLHMLHLSKCSNWRVFVSEPDVVALSLVM